MGTGAEPWKTADPFATVAEDTGHFPHHQPDLQRPDLTCPSVVSSCVVFLAEGNSWGTASFPSLYKPSSFLHCDPSA